MIVFELTMPHKGSWNNKWSSEHRRHIRLRREYEVPKTCVGKDFYYRWDDGWEACVSVSKVPYDDATKLNKQSSGFCGYDWMIASIIHDGYIHTMEDVHEI